MPDEIELVPLIDFSAHGPDRGLLFVESYQTREAPPIANPEPDGYATLERKAELRDRIFGALTWDWQTVPALARKAGLTDAQVRSAMRSLIQRRFVESQTQPGMRTIPRTSYRRIR